MTSDEHDDLPPSAEDLAAYRRGALDLARFDVIDSWLAAQPLDVQERLLLQGDEDTAGRPLAIALPRVAAPVSFTSEGGAQRYIPGGIIGCGGMGIVHVAQDTMLEREVALKTCRPRSVDEDMASYLRRVRAFRREAAITAQLEHPAIVPIHDLGRGAADEPAYVMKRLVGTPLSQRVEQVRDGGVPELSETVEIMLRIAEAVAHAHRSGLVHRDLKPDNIFLGSLGEVSIIDWGLAGRVGEAALPAGSEARGSGLTRFGAGTASWMAPEQLTGSSADPRMDVFALGGLLMALLTGHAPRTDDGRLDLTPLARQGAPRGLVALARRCLEVSPGARYPDGAAVAGELRRWLSQGLTLAQRPSFVRRLWAYLRTTPTVAAILVVCLLVCSTTMVTHHLGHRDHRRDLEARLVALAGTPLTDLTALRLAQSEVRAALTDHRSDLGVALEARLTAAIETLERQTQIVMQRQRLLAVFNRYQEHGPRPTDAPDLATALQEAGIHLSDIPADTNAIAQSPIRMELLEALVQLQKILILDGTSDGRRTTIPQLIMAAAPNPSWRSVGALLAKPEVEAHDLRFCPCPDSQQALLDAGASDVLLMTYGPEPRLLEHARERLRDDPGAFWPRVVSARDSLAAGRLDEARNHAFVALGVAPRSFWPHILLAYVAMEARDDERLAAHVRAAMAANPTHVEPVVLEAVRLARAGKRAEAFERIKEPSLVAHLRFHLEHPFGHPMEHSVRALVEAGIVLPEGPALIGPLVPATGNHHHP